MEYYQQEIIHNLNKPLFSNTIIPNNHLIFVKYSQQRYYKYCFELLDTLTKKSSFKNKNKIFHISLYYLLNILYNCGNTPYCSNLDLMILSCFFLGIKTIEEQKNMISISKLKKIYPEKYLLYENAEIKRCEMLCIYLLKYNINFITIYDCICFLLKNENDLILKSLIFEELDSKMLNEGVNYYIYKYPIELAQEVIFSEKQKYIKINSSIIINRNTITKKLTCTNTNNCKIFFNFGNEESLSTSASFGSGQNSNNKLNKIKDIKNKNIKDFIDNDITIINNNSTNFSKNKNQGNLIKLINNQKNNNFFISKSKITKNNIINNIHNMRYTINKKSLNKSTCFSNLDKNTISQSNSYGNTFFNSNNNINEINFNEINNYDYRTSINLRNNELNKKEKLRNNNIFKKPLIKHRTNQNYLLNIQNCYIPKDFNICKNMSEYDIDKFNSNKKTSKNNFLKLYKNLNNNIKNCNIINDEDNNGKNFNSNICKYKNIKKIKGKSCLKKYEKIQ